MTDGFGGLGGGGGAASPEDARLQQFLIQEKAKAELQEAINKLNNVCWDVCVDKMRDKMDYRTEQCLSNCTDRFLDTTLFIGKRFQQLLQQQGGGGAF